MDRATVDEALCCAGRSLCCGCYNLRVIICARGRASRFFFVGAARAARLRDFLGARRDGVSQQAAAVLYAATRVVLRPRVRYLGQRQCHRGEGRVCTRAARLRARFFGAGQQC